MECFRFDLDQHLSDNDQLTLLSGVRLNRQGPQGRSAALVDASWGDLLKYNNVQELELIPETKRNCKNSTAAS